MTNNVNYKDYSNRTTFDGSIPNDDEMIVPVVLTKELKQLIDLKGYKNYSIETHKLKYNKKIKVVFTVIKKENYNTYKTTFNSKTHEYLNGTYPPSLFEKDLEEDEDVDQTSLYSLDKIMSDVIDEDKLSKDPTGTTKYDDVIKCAMMLDDLIDSFEDQIAKKVIQMKVEGYKKNEIHEKLYPSLKKTQAYDEINKILDEAVEKIEQRSNTK